MNITPTYHNELFYSLPKASSLGPMKMQQVRTTLSMTLVTRKGKTNRKLPTAHSHVSKNFTDQDLFANNLVNTTRDAHFNDVRWATHGTGCLPIDSLCIGHFATINLESETSSTEDSLSSQQNTWNRARKNSWSTEDTWSSQQTTEYTHCQQDRGRRK